MNGAHSLETHVSASPDSAGGTVRTSVPLAAATESSLAPAANVTRGTTVLPARKCAVIDVVATADVRSQDLVSARWGGRALTVLRTSLAQVAPTDCVCTVPASATLASQALPVRCLPVP